MSDLILQGRIKRHEVARTKAVREVKTQVKSFEPKYLYLMKSDKVQGVYKVGTSKDPESRAKTMVGKWRVVDSVLTTAQEAARAELDLKARVHRFDTCPEWFTIPEGWTELFICDEELTSLEHLRQTVGK